MKHKIGFNALSRTSSHRKAMKRNMVTSLFRYERIETTKAKALEVRRMAEKMITGQRPIPSPTDGSSPDITDKAVAQSSSRRSHRCSPIAMVGIPAS